MGGNALKAFGAERKSKSDYQRIVRQTLNQIHHQFPECRLELIESYAAKKSFGDADILISQDQLPSDWEEKIKQALEFKHSTKNGNVFSCLVDNLQVDLIQTPEQTFEFAKNYFNFNDLGNLMGRVAHKMGFKYGHKGLLYRSDASTIINII